MTHAFADDNGIPDPWDQCWQIGANWFLSYFSVATSDAFGKFYANYDGLLDSFALYWAKIAQEFKNHKSVMGYNLLNGKHKIYACAKTRTILIKKKLIIEVGNNFIQNHGLATSTKILPS